MNKKLFVLLPAVLLALTGCDGKGSDSTSTSQSTTESTSDTGSTSTSSDTGSTSASSDTGSSSSSDTSSSDTSTSTEPVVTVKSIVEVSALAENEKALVNVAVLAINSKNVMVYDASGYALLYLAATGQGSLAVGDYVSVTISKVTYNSGLELVAAADAEFTKLSSTAPTAPAAGTATTAELEALITAGLPVAKRYSAIATVAQNGTYYNFKLQGSAADTLSEHFGYASFGEKSWCVVANVDKSYAVDLVIFQIKTNQFVCYCASATEIIPAATSVSLKDGEAVAADFELAKNSTKQLTASILPAAANQEINWTSTDTGVASVVNGLVTGLSDGTSIIRAAAVSDESKYSEVRVTVSSATKVANLEELGAALADSSIANIQLSADIDIGAEAASITRSVNIDLGTHSLSVGDTNAFIVNGSGIVVNISNGTIAATGAGGAAAGGYQNGANVINGTLNLNGITANFSGRTWGIALNGGTVNLKDSTLTSNYIGISGNNTYENMTVTLDNSHIVSVGKDAGIYMPCQVSVDILNGSTINAGVGVDMRMGHLKVDATSSITASTSVPSSYTRTLTGDFEPLSSVELNKFNGSGAWQDGSGISIRANSYAASAGAGTLKNEIALDIADYSKVGQITIYDLSTRAGTGYATAKAADADSVIDQMVELNKIWEVQATAVKYSFDGTTVALVDKPAPDVKAIEVLPASFTANNSYTAPATATFTDSSSQSIGVTVNAINHTTAAGTDLRFGRKSSTASSPVLYTTNAESLAIKKIEIVWSQVSTSLTSAKLQTSTDGSTWADAVDFLSAIPSAVGTQTIALTSPAANLYYKLAFEDAGNASSNGVYRFTAVNFIA